MELPTTERSPILSSAPPLCGSKLPTITAFRPTFFSHCETGAISSRQYFTSGENESVRLSCPERSVRCLWSRNTRPSLRGA